MGFVMDRLVVINGSEGSNSGEIASRHDKPMVVEARFLFGLGSGRLKCEDTFVHSDEEDAHKSGVPREETPAGGEDGGVKGDCEQGETNLRDESHFVKEFSQDVRVRLLLRLDEGSGKRVVLEKRTFDLC